MALLQDQALQDGPLARLDCSTVLVGTINHHHGPLSIAMGLLLVSRLEAESVADARFHRHHNCV